MDRPISRGISMYGNLLSVLSGPVRVDVFTTVTRPQARIPRTYWTVVFSISESLCMGCRSRTRGSTVDFRLRICHGTRG